MSVLPERYMIGCNYWDSQSGTEMWRAFDSETVDRDFAHLKSAGCRTLRVFPNWRDFQPVMTIDGYQGELTEYRFDDGSPDGQTLTRADGLDPVMLDRMKTVCRLAEKHGLSLIVSVITGWMSGRLFMPAALKGKNPIADPECLRWEYRFAKGLAEALKDEKSVAAWDLGNECNCMGRIESSHEAYVWTMTIVSGIKAGDPTRPILSGTHSLGTDACKGWSLRDQGELTDALTPHPYPGSPTIGANTMPCDSYRVVMLPTAQMQLYADIGGKPALIEEQGTLNNIYANRDMASHTAALNAALCWAAGGRGYLWWCAHDQKNLDFAPYSLSMRELGLLEQDYSPKPAAKRLRDVAERLDSLGGYCVENRHTDAVCVLTRGYNTEPVAMMSCLLGRQAGIDMRFVCHDMPIPAAPVYLLPSVTGWTPLYKRAWTELLRRVHDDGAVLYVSWDGAALESFEEVFALRSQGIYKTGSPETGTFRFDGGTQTLRYVCTSSGIHLESTGAQVLAEKQDGSPLFTQTAYGKGQVFFLAFGLEKMLWEQPDAFEGGNPFADIYRTVHSAAPAGHVRCHDPLLCMTRHECGGHEYVVVVNISCDAKKPALTVEDAVLTPIIGLSADGTIAGGDFAVFKLTQQTR